MDAAFPCRAEREVRLRGGAMGVALLARQRLGPRHAPPGPLHFHPGQTPVPEGRTGGAPPYWSRRRRATSAPMVRAYSMIASRTGCHSASVISLKTTGDAKPRIGTWRLRQSW